ncbi:transcriptional regulator [Sphingobacteriaceae bacterium]|nr:transcriptional regulator [Sphingobacteriaceae bacterium]
MDLKKTEIDFKNCDPDVGMALLEVVNLFAGKWRMIIFATLYMEDMRFKELQQYIPNITPRMLSKELKDLEMSGIVKRHVYDEIPVLIQYGLTDSARELLPTFKQFVEWGLRHRKKAKKK